MKRCVIHIGAHKTGSTSIQYSLDGFADDRLVYAKFDDPNHSLAMFSLFSPHPEKHHIHRGNATSGAKLSDYVSKRRKELERAISAANGRTLVISGEDISILSEDGLVRIRDFFMQHFDDLRIVGYVRPPAALIASVFQERIKAGAVQLRLDREHLNYQARFEKFDKIFGRSNVTLWKFDPAFFPGGCAVRDFCARLEIALPQKRIVRLNESLPREAVSMFFTYRVLSPKHGYAILKAGQCQMLGELIAKVCNSRFRFSPDVIGPILQKNLKDIRWMEARLGQSLAEPLGAHRPGDIRSESDLLQPDPEAVTKLLALLGKNAPKGIRGQNPDEVAQLVHAFRTKHARRHLTWGWRRKSRT